MSYEVILSDTASASLRALDRQASSRIIRKLETIRGNPFGHVKRLAGLPLFSLRVGDYLVIMDIKSGQMLIFVVRIGHRKNFYDGL